MNAQMVNLKKIVTSFNAFTGFIHGFISCCAKTGGGLCFTVHMTGKVRRFLLVHFCKSYVQQQLLHRKGDCLQCGVCCNLLFTCPMLTKNGLCLIYSVCRPLSCRVFPIDQRDIDEVKLCGGKCGYAFPKTDL